MKFKLSKTQQYFLGILIVAVIGSVLLLNQKRKFSKLMISSEYTIGTIFDFKKNPRRDDQFLYSFKINNIEYKREIAFNKSNNLFVGKRYFVVFEEGNPENSMLIPFLFVPDSITKSPVEGWREPPIPIDKNEIKKFLENY